MPFLAEDLCILIEISLKYVSESPTDNKSGQIQVMACFLKRQ